MVHWPELSPVSFPESVTGNLGDITSSEVEWIQKSHHCSHYRVTFSKTDLSTITMNSLVLFLEWATAMELVGRVVRFRK
jgi:hypothetical protein